MGSYEEQVVDGAVDAAWLAFRVRLADRLVELGDGDEIVLAVTPPAEQSPLRVRFCAVDDESIEARFVGLVSQSRRLRIRRSTWARLRSLGVVASGGRMTVERSRVDHVAYTVYAFLHEELQIVHPSFVDVPIGNLVLVDPPQDLVAPKTPAPLPESIVPTSRDDLVVWVDRTLTQWLGYVPKKRGDGSIGINREGDCLTIRVSGSRPLVEVFAVVASDVDRKRARKEVAVLNSRFHFFRFFLHQDSLFMATTVSAIPFAPEHLSDAIDMTLHFLKHRAPKVATKLVRREPVQETPAAEPPCVDEQLLLVYGSADAHEAMIEMARGLTNDSTRSLDAWRHAASAAGKLAREKASQLERGPVQNALIEQYLVWRKVAQAMRAAVAEIGNERQVA
ncbi:hypothetical protein [Aeromicrobium sp. NPDC092404]|uniref:T3SS (YopN, CesT) and YbjN peptide-binding chaperone 1 n=1 Tax=Aeromicrobium sp. NPDC092404 TaxID=3154976 RepID=UPI003429F649